MAATPAVGLTTTMQMKEMILQSGNFQGLIRTMAGTPTVELTAAMQTKEMILQSGDYQCFIDVSATDTLADVRAKALDEFDEDMLPSRDFFMAIGQPPIRLSKKQEGNKLAWDVMAASRAVSLHAKPDTNKRTSMTAAPEESSPKKPRKNEVYATPGEIEDLLAECTEVLSVGKEEMEESDTTPTRKLTYGLPADEASTKEEMLDSEDSDLFPPDETEKSDETENCPEDAESVLLEEESDPPAEQPMDNEEPMDVVVLNNPAEAENPHAKYDQAVEESCQLLQQLDQLLQDRENAFFCSQARRKEWVDEIAASLAKTAPHTIIGCLGSTGVGKSSLLNALLDEAAVLPTSGSRGCTAAVVELRFNADLLSPTNDTTVYKGAVELMSLPEWLAELKILLDECSTQDSQKVHHRPPDEQRQPETAAAWSKINQVYGSGTMESHVGKDKAYVWDRLSRNPRIVQLLATESGEANTILVQEGSVDAAQANLLLCQLSNLKGKLRRSQKRWAKTFRSKINDYVYRKGNGGGPQTWPLIKKVVLHGPWSVLQTGACLVDLPGVRDANAARARVAQSYLQNCHAIWVVAPIKRAVDDGTAKELLGEQFKRRLLMDGQYGNVSFICTQTDDCELTEIMRDHEDVARMVPGRWEKMTSLLDQITAIDKERYDLGQEEDDLKVDLEEADQMVNDLKQGIKEAKDDNYVDFDDDGEDAVIGMEKLLEDKKKLASAILAKLREWRRVHKEGVLALDNKSNSLQKDLKAMAAMVRNEYSTKCLQDDFRAGLEELVRPPDEMQDDATANDNPLPPPLPNDYQMEVHCVASNDYLKIQQIKPASDGPPNTFARPEDTQIPSLRLAVHRTTAKFRSSFADTFVNTASDMLDLIKLCAAENREDSADGHRFHKIFERELKAADSKLQPILSAFIRKAEEKVNNTLQPSLLTGAAKGSMAALATVTSWGSTKQRDRSFRSPEQNGLSWSTYNATAQRNGVYNSPRAGSIDMNQELCDPMEKEFSADWQQIMDSAIRSCISDAQIMVKGEFELMAKQVATAFAQVGMESTRLNGMANTASRTCQTSLTTAFEAMLTTATNAQRDLNRSLLPKVRAQMKQGYYATISVPGGTGKFARMKDALSRHVGTAVRTMFSEATQELLKAIGSLIKQLASMIQATGQVVYKTLHSIYSVCWEDSQQNSMEMQDPVTQEKMRACRDKLLPDLTRMRQAQDKAMMLLGINREEVEFDVVGVGSLEDRNAKQMEAAKQSGNFNGLLASDSDSDDMIFKMAPGFVKPVKSEQRQETTGMVKLEQYQNVAIPPLAALQSFEL